MTPYIAAITGMTCAWVAAGVVAYLCFGVILIGACSRVVPLNKPDTYFAGVCVLLWPLLPCMAVVVCCSSIIRDSVSALGWLARKIGGAK